MNVRWIKRLKTTTSLLALLSLVACGGGGSSGGSTVGNPAANAIEGTVQSGVTVLSDAQNSQIQSVQQNADGSLSVTGSAGALDQLQVGQLVTIPANAAQGLPFGYAGTVVAVPGSNQLQLEPAAVEDVFQKLNIDIDTARDGATIAGIVVAPGARASFNQTSGTQAGLSSTSCNSTQGGLTVTGGIACTNGLLSGEITISQDFTLKKKGSSTQTGIARLFGTIRLDNGKVIYQADFNPLKYPTSGGWATLKGEISADITGKVGISTPQTDGSPNSQLEIPAWSELLRADGKNIWNKSWQYGKYFELSGLNGDDKKGLIPLAGIIIAPTSPTGKPFKGDLSAHQLGFYGSSSAVILWVYIDLSGNLTVSGEVDLLQASMHVHRGYQLKAVGNQLVGSGIDHNGAPTVTAPYLKGSASASQTIGINLVADVLIGGVRPMTVKAKTIAATVSSTLQGEGGYQWTPQQRWTGNLCYDSSASVYSSLTVQARLKAKLDAAWTREGVAELNQTWPQNWYTMPIASDCIGTAADTTPPVTTPPVTAAGLLNDTGVTASQCYQAGSDTLVDCASAAALALNNAQDGMIGRDAAINGSADGKLGFSFTAVSGGCVKDSVTGLTWEVKTTNSGLRDRNKTYTNFGDDRTGDASAYVTAVNAAGLCGYSDWRLPTADELLSLVDYSVSYYSVAYPLSATIDATWFPHAKASVNWTSSPYAGDSGNAWGVNFGSGGFYHYGRYSTYYVRLVR